MKNNYLKLGKIIRNEREEKGFSRRKLSALVDISDTELKRRVYTCPKCGDRLVPRKGPYGPFIGCSNYPSCKYVKKY